MADWTWTTTIAASVAAHVATLAWLPTDTPTTPVNGAPTFEVVEIPVEASPPPDHEPEPEPEPTPDEPTEAPPLQAPSPEADPTQVARGDASSPAEAGQVLTAEPHDDAEPAVADFTMVQGEATRYAGGVTSSRGRSRKAVQRVGDPQGSVDGEKVAAKGASAEDRSRPARPAAAAWSCSHLFPSAADQADVHHALVTVVVQVGPSGQPRGVSVVSDPGHGFGAAARACAMSQGYVAALDARGRPIDGSTAPFSVRFVR